MSTFLHYTTTVSVLFLLTIGASSISAEPAEPRLARVSLQGTCHVVALFARFPGEEPEGATPPSYARDLFRQDLPGSFTHFYHEMSLGTFAVKGTVLPRAYTSHHPPSGYDPSREVKGNYFGRFNREVLQNADPDVDFGRFDNDGPDGLPNSGDDDGYVDFLFIIVKSSPSGFFTGNAAGIAELGLEEDFITDDPAPSGYIKINPYLGATQRVWNFAHAVSVMAHEFGHALGLPDLYDITHKGSEDHPEDDGAGIGNWGIMGRGALGWKGTGSPVPFCAWSREQLGWAHVVEITEEVVDQVLTDVATTGTVYKIRLGKEGSYYLLENRQSSKSYYDRNIPRDGLLIWHIQRRSGNRDEGDKLVDLVCADGIYPDRGYPDGKHAAPDSGGDNLDFWAHDEAYRIAHTGNLGDATDVFDGVVSTKFTPNTNPTSEQGVCIEHIRCRGTDIVADIRVPTWSGAITDPIVWSGVINVTGDIVVQEGALLTICSGTVVRISPTDGLGSGFDPDRCEIDVLGGFRVVGYGEPVRFTTEGKGTWLGIRLHERTVSVSTGPEVRIEDCSHPHGIFWSEHPDVNGVELLPCIVQDSELGNGDGVLNPGETARLVLDIRNWTARPFRDLCVTFSTQDPFVRRHPPGGFSNRMIEYGMVACGKKLRITGSLTVSPDCPEDHSISFSVEFKDATRVWTETFLLPVQRIAHGNQLVTDIENIDDSLPISFALAQNIPNPFNAETVIRFELPRPAELALTIFNAAGQTIRQWQGSWPAGRHHLTWNSEDKKECPWLLGYISIVLKPEALY